LFAPFFIIVVHDAGISVHDPLENFQDCSFATSGFVPTPRQDRLLFAQIVLQFSPLAEFSRISGIGVGVLGGRNGIVLVTNWTIPTGLPLFPFASSVKLLSKWYSAIVLLSLAKG